MISVESSFIYFLSVVSIVCALFVVTQRRLTRAVAALMLVLVSTAGMYVILNAEFLTGVQVLVYVGGIVMLIIFAIMLTGAGKNLEEDVPVSKKIFAFLFSSLFFLCSAYAILNSPIRLSVAPPQSSVKALGLKMLDYGTSGYALAFEVISLLLLAVLVGAIVVARKSPGDNND